jgi:sRNA-binding carbon storage regulator CsrA
MSLVIKLRRGEILRVGDAIIQVTNDPQNTMALNIDAPREVIVEHDKKGRIRDQEGTPNV